MHILKSTSSLFNGLSLFDNAFLVKIGQNTNFPCDGACDDSIGFGGSSAAEIENHA